ncbi:MAG: ATP-binding protein [Thermodesulfobacteriota bacterium]
MEELKEAQQRLIEKRKQQAQEVTAGLTELTYDYPWLDRSKIKFRKCGCGRDLDEVVGGEPYCSVCSKETREKIREKQRREEIERRVCEVKKDVFGSMEKAGVSPHYTKCSFDNFQKTGTNEKYLRFCQKYVEDPVRNLFFSGTCGSGKTHLVAAIVRELLLKGKKVKFISVPDLLLQIRKTFNGKSELSDIDYIERYGRYEYVVLDDFGAEKTTDWARMILYMIVDMRIRSVRPTIVTSNLSLEQIEEDVDARLASRLGGFQVIIFACEDWRKR